MFLRIGIDVGGTNTDAVLLDADKAESPVLNWIKVPTTADVTEGIQHAIKDLLKLSTISTSDIKCVTVGTTQFLNAIVGRSASKLQKVGVIRLASDNFTRLAPPFVDFPPDLRDILCGHIGFINGGLNIDASEIGGVVKEEVIEQCKILKQKGIQSVVIVGVFSPIDYEYKQEFVVREIILQELEDVDVVCSAEVGRLGILERENAAILNASLLKLGRIFVTGLRRALLSTGVEKARLFLSCNDGTMISATEALIAPVKVIASGPANSMIGASFILSSRKEGVDDTEIYSNQGDALIIIDIGGSTTDAGVLLETGYPRQASAYSDVAKVRVNFAMPDVQSIGLGGGSIVKYRYQDGLRIATSIGPESVGLDLSNKALCFGGDVLTATDIVIAAGLIPNFGSTPVELEESLVISAKGLIQQMLEDLIDEIKTTAAPLPVALVGGGSILLHDDLRGTTAVLRNHLAPVANAIGAAEAKLSMSLDLICPIENGRSSAEDAKILNNKIDEATEACIMKGARKDSITVITKDLMLLSYISNKARIVIQVVGELDTSSSIIPEVWEVESTLEPDYDLKDALESHPSKSNMVIPLATAKFDPNYRPTIIGREWILSEIDLEFLSIGCYILGCAGGGSPYAMYLQAREMIRSGEKLRIIDIADLPSTANLIPTGKMGSPMVSTERPSIELLVDAVQEMLTYVKLETLSALVCVEVGGSNGISPLVIGSSATYNVPMVDGDLMGRAYPTFEKITPFVLGSGNVNDLLPITLSSGDGTNLVLRTSKNTDMVDKALRAACVEMGCSAGVALHPIHAKDLINTGILRTHSLAWRLGRAVKKFQTEQSEISIAESLITQFGGSSSARAIFEGKLTAVENRLIKGHSYGSIVIRGSSSSPRNRNTRVASPDPSDQEQLKITFKNENLLAELFYPDNSSTEPLATVPDLIMVLDSRTGLALGVPEYRYGLKVLVLVAASHPYWTTPKGLEIGGPRAFGIGHIEYQAVGKYVEPRSVIGEFAG